ncbi:hypothetical protein F5Y03DRAFT_349469 [Xylaria venustula]|nr:hypothetical protein F5Y03DRAFT_349469 [Xylaria venustula]
MSTKKKSRCLGFGNAARDALVINNKLLNEPSFEKDVSHDHARVNTHGTYLDGIKDSLESLEEYQNGGDHPFDLGDGINAFGRYRIIHELCRGASEQCSCRGMRDPAYVAVQVRCGCRDFPGIYFDQSNRLAPEPNMLSDLWTLDLL